MQSPRGPNESFALPCLFCLLTQSCLQLLQIGGDMLFFQPPPSAFHKCARRLSWLAALPLHYPV